MNPATSSDISVDELRTLLERHEPVTVLDIRESDVRAEWAIPGSVHIDRLRGLKAGDTRRSTRWTAPDQPVVTVCAAGKTSLIAAALLARAGHRRALTLRRDEGLEPGLEHRRDCVPGSAARILQVRRTGKGCLSYVVGSEGQALVIDAASTRRSIAISRPSRAGRGRGRYPHPRRSSLSARAPWLTWPARRSTCPTSGGCRIRLPRSMTAPNAHRDATISVAAHTRAYAEAMSYLLNGRRADHRRYPVPGRRRTSGPGGQRG